MSDGFIAVIDSGIGGIYVLEKLIKAFPNERFLYYGDNGNAPYGNLSKTELLLLAMKSIDAVKRYSIKALVVACNTLSVNVLKNIEEYAGVSVFGVFPPVELCVLNKERTLLLATERTAENYRGIENVDSVGLPTLAEEIENAALRNKVIDVSEIISGNHSGVYSDEKGYYDSVILGCTHYGFVKNEIFNHFCPRKIIGGEKFTINNLRVFLNCEKSSLIYNENRVFFLGEFADFNKKIFDLSGQKGQNLSKKIPEI